MSWWLRGLFQHSDAGLLVLDRSMVETAGMNVTAEQIVLTERTARRWLGLGLVFKRRNVRDTCALASGYEESLRMLRSELEAARVSRQILEDEYMRQRKGVGTLLTYIHRTHRLDMPIALGTIVGELLKSKNSR